MKITHTYEDKPYKLVGTGKMKVDGNWVDSVSYQASYVLEDISQDTIFTRTKEDFEGKFQEWLPDFSPYIKEESAVLFLSLEDLNFFRELPTAGCFFRDGKLPEVVELGSPILGLSWEESIQKFKKVLVPVQILDAESLIRIKKLVGEISKSNAIESVTIVATHCDIAFNVFLADKKLCQYDDDGLFYFDSETHAYEEVGVARVLTTDSTGVNYIQHRSSLEVIDCQEFFADKLI